MFERGVLLLIPRYHLKRAVARLNGTMHSCKRAVEQFPWHHVKIVILTALFIAAVAAFLTADAPNDEHDVSNLAAVSASVPLISNNI